VQSKWTCSTGPNSARWSVGSVYAISVYTPRLVPDENRQRERSRGFASPSRNSWPGASRIEHGERGRPRRRFDRIRSCVPTTSVTEFWTDVVPTRTPMPMAGRCGRAMGLGSSGRQARVFCAGWLEANILAPRGLSGAVPSVGMPGGCSGGRGPAVPSRAALLPRSPRQSSGPYRWHISSSGLERDRLAADAWPGGRLGGSGSPDTVCGDGAAVSRVPHGRRTWERSTARCRGPKSDA